MLLNTRGKRLLKMQPQKAHCKLANTGGVTGIRKNTHTYAHILYAIQSPICLTELLEVGNAPSRNPHSIAPPSWGERREVRWGEFNGSEQTGAVMTSKAHSMKLSVISERAQCYPPKDSWDVILMLLSCIPDCLERFKPNFRETFPSQFNWH